MAKNKNESAIPGYDVLVLKRRGITRDLPSGTESLQWVTNTATLIYGEHDAVVVDTFATIDQNQQLVDWITKSGKNQVSCKFKWTLRWNLVLNPEVCMSTIIMKSHL